MSRGPSPLRQLTVTVQADDPVAGDPAIAAAMTCADRAVPASEVPVDVVAARMCATDNGLARWYAPQDSLHADLAPLLEVLGSLEPVPESTDEERYYCADDGGYGFDLRLALASGEVVSVRGDTGGCSTVRIGGKDVVGSDEVVAAFLDGITAPRTVSGPPDEVVELTLGCGMPDPGDGGDAAPVTSRQVATLMTDLSRGTRRDQGFAHLTCDKDDFY